MMWQKVEVVWVDGSVRLLGASASKPAMGCGGSKAQPASELEVGEGVVDRKPSITITLSSDGEADDDEETVVIEENSNRWLKKQEAEVGEVEHEVEELLEVAKEDITAKLELQVDDNKVEEEGNMNEDTNNKIEEGEGVKQGNSDGAKASLDMLGKLATTLSSNENSEDPVEAQQTENDEKTADLIEEKTKEEYEEEGTVKASSEDKAQAEPAPEPGPPAPEPSAPPAPVSGGGEEEEVDKLEVDKVDEPLTFSPMAEEASEAGAIPMAANAIRQEAEMAHNEAIS